MCRKGETYANARTDAGKPVISNIVIRREKSTTVPSMAKHMAK